MLVYLLQHFELFLLILLRVVAFIATAPMLSLRVWPAWAKIGLAAFVSMAVLPNVHGEVPDLMTDPGPFIVIAVKESVLGMFLGFVASMVVSAVSIAGSILDVQIGFNSVSMFDPQSSMSSGIMGTFQSALFTLYFLGLNGLDGLMLAIMNSYRFVPLDHFLLPGDTYSFLTHLLGVVMVLSLQMVAPVFVALLLTDITLALLSRAVPQVNVYVVGLPAKLFVGVSVFAVVMPGLVYIFGQLFGTLFSQLNNVLHWLGG